MSNRRRRPWVTDPMKIEIGGVIGAGQMGNGIAHVCALPACRSRCWT
jgi:predicted homoserine dehydrogenase-like protein